MLLFCVALSPVILHAQNIDQGYYNDFAYGPHGVHGNLKLKKPSKREFYLITKISDSITRVIYVNPSGITLKTFTITFFRGILSHVERANQWGNITLRRKYEMISKDLFKVTELLNGMNNFLPCKYALETFNDDLLIETSFHSFSGRLKNNEPGYAIIRNKRYADKIRFAELMETSYYDENNRPVISKYNGVHKIKYEFDQSDNIISESYYNIYDRPTMDKTKKIYGIRHYHDQDNRDIKREFLDSSGRMATNYNGIAGLLMKYEDGYLVKMSNFDSLGHIAHTNPDIDGIAMYKMDYDQNGNQIKFTALNEEDKPIMDQGGVAITFTTYTSENMATCTSYFDELGKPVNSRDGIHQYIDVYDSLGRSIQLSYFDNEGHPTKDRVDQVFMTKTSYDSNGREISESYWKNKDTAMPRWNGTYEVRKRYNDDGQATEYDYYDQNGDLMKTDEGYSTCKILVDQDGFMYARQYLYRDELINKSRGVSRGFSIIRYEYDSVGKITQILFYGNQHEAINATVSVADPVQAHRIQFFYRGSHVVEQWYFALDDKEPFLKLNCLKNDYLNPSGIGLGRKNAN